MVQRAHGNVLHGPWANPRDLEQRFEVSLHVEGDSAIGYLPRELPNRACARADDAGFFQRRVGKLRRRREQPFETGGPVDRLAPLRGDATSNGGCGADGDLLTEYRAHGELERIPGAWQADAGVSGTGALQQSITRQCLRHERRIGVDVEHAGDPFGNLRNQRRIRDRHVYRQRVRAGHRRHRDRAHEAARQYGALISGRIDSLHAGRGARRQEPGYRRPVVRRPIWQHNTHGRNSIGRPTATIRQ
jgi:hypothetical protein